MEAAGSNWSRLCRRLGVTVYRGEGRAALLLFFSFFLCLTFQYAAKTVRQATFVDSLGAAQLPWVYLMVAVVSYPAAWLIAHFSRVASLRKVAISSFSIVALSLLGFWWLFGLGSNWVPVAFYVWVSVAIAVTMTQLWGLASETFDARQAKRLFGFLGGGALLGGIAGGLVARFAAAQAAPRDALLVAAALLVAIALLLPLLDRKPVASRSAGHVVARESKRKGWSLLRRSPYVRLIAAVMLLTVVVSQVVDLQFNWAVEVSTGSLEDRTAFFGNFFSLMGVAALFFQLFLTTRIHKALGVGVALRVLPASLGAGTLALLITASALPGSLLIAVLGLKLIESGMRYSIDDSSRELLFLPLTRDDRVEAKAFVDIVVKRGAKGVAAIVLLPVTLGWLTPVSLGWLSLAAVVVWLWLVSRVVRGYVRSFRRGLERREIDRGAFIDLSDGTTLALLVESLGSLDGRQVVHSIDLLADQGHARLVPPLLLFHDDPEVRLRTLRVLAAEGRSDALPLVERRLADDSPEVRAEATRVLAEMRHEDACEMMLPRLGSHEVGVKAAAIACLATHGDGEMASTAEETLEDLISEAEAEARIEAARVIGALSEQRFAGRLVLLLYDPEPEVVRAAIGAIRRRCERDGPNPLYLPTLISLLANRRLKHDARQALAAYGADAVPALVHMMEEPDEPIWVRRAIPKTIARIEDPGAREALLQGLGVHTDPFLRRKLLEALASTGKAPLDSVAAQRVRSEIRVEARRYLLMLADLYTLDPGAAEEVHALRIASPVRLLDRLLAERAEDHRRNLFFLLSFLYERESIWNAFRGLGEPSLRPSALEYLDYTLGGDEHRDVLAAIGDAPLVEKLGRSERTFGIARGSRSVVVAKHLSPQDDAKVDAPFLTVGAIHAVVSDQLIDLLPVVESLLSTATDDFVLETATWALGTGMAQGRAVRMRQEGPREPPGTAPGRARREGRDRT